MTKTIYICSDHRGFAIKSEIIEILKQRNFSVKDMGTNSEESCSAADYAIKTAKAMKNDPNSVGILICGSGQAMTMTANRFSHMRAAMCLNSTMARLARQHNDANAIVLGAHTTGREIVFDVLDTFLSTEFLGMHYTERNKVLSQIGEK